MDRLARVALLALGLLALGLLGGCSEPSARVPQADGSGDRRVTEAGRGAEAGAIDGSPSVDRSLVPDQRPPDPEKTYWVSPTGAAPWSSCKGATPLAGGAACSLATANTSAVAGDTIILRDGTYVTPLAPARSGAATARITFVRHPGETPKISGVAAGISLPGRSHVTVDGLTVDGCKVFADLTGTEHVWIYRSTLVNSSDTGGWPMGIKMYNNARYDRLVDCTIGHVGYMTDSDDKGGVMNLGNWENASDTTSYNLLEGNTFYHGGHHVLEIAAHHNIIRNNTFHNEDWTACSRTSTGKLCGNRDIVIYREAVWNVVDGNRFGFTGASIDDNAGASGLSIRGPHTIARRNLFFYCGGPGLSLYVDSTTSYEASNDYVYHNVLYKNGVSPVSAGDPRYTYGFLFDNCGGNAAPLPIVNVSFKNNLLHADVGGSIYFYYTDAAKQTILGNYWSKIAGSGVTSLPGNLSSSADPLFADITPSGTVTNIAKFDFHLKSGSPAIDKGVFLTTTASAGSGTSLVVADASYFIDGYGITDGDLIQLEGSPQPVRVKKIDYAKNELTLEASRTWKAGEGVAQPYSGAVPDIGAYETP